MLLLVLPLPHCTSLNASAGPVDNVKDIFEAQEARKFMQQSLLLLGLIKTKQDLITEMTLLLDKVCFSLHTCPDKLIC